MLGGPAVALAHGLSPTYQSPLPLAVYVAGAAATVALSFAFVLARDVRAGTPDPGRVAPVPGRAVGLRAIGVLGWAWIMAQGIAGGSSDAAVAGLFLWIYGWVGIAILSALVFPVWEWLDPFATLHDAGAWVLRRLGVRGWEPSLLPRPARLWPAVAGFAFVVWLELVAVPGNAELTVVLAGYTVLTLALDGTVRTGPVARARRDLHRLVPHPQPAVRRGRWRPPPDRRPARTPSTTGRSSGGPSRRASLEGTWEPARIVLVAIGTGAIVYDGLSQTVVFATVFGAPALVARTLLLFGFLGLIVAGALYVARTVSPGAIGAGLLPIAVGYLVAHYLTYLLIDGQGIVIAVRDPLQQGWDLFGTAFYEPSSGWLPPGLVWTTQLVAVVGGHMLGAWAGHVRAQRDLDAAPVPNGKPGRDLRHRTIHDPDPLPGPRRDVRRQEIPLAVMMVALTTLTLWSLGQAIVVEEVAAAADPVARPITSPRSPARSEPQPVAEAERGTQSVMGRTTAIPSTTPGPAPGPRRHRSRSR